MESISELSFFGRLDLFFIVCHWLHEARWTCSAWRTAVAFNLHTNAPNVIANCNIESMELIECAKCIAHWLHSHTNRIRFLLFPIHIECNNLFYSHLSWLRTFIRIRKREKCVRNSNTHCSLSVECFVGYCYAVCSCSANENHFEIE